jgi:hypothetical protein
VKMTVPSTTATSHRGRTGSGIWTGGGYVDVGGCRDVGACVCDQV